MYLIINGDLKLNTLVLCDIILYIYIEYICKYTKKYTKYVISITM